MTQRLSMIVFVYVVNRLVDMGSVEWAVMKKAVVMPNFPFQEVRSAEKKIDLYYHLKSHTSDNSVIYHIYLTYVELSSKPKSILPS